MISFLWEQIPCKRHKKKEKRQTGKEIEKVNDSLIKKSTADKKQYDYLTKEEEGQMLLHDHFRMQCKSNTWLICDFETDLTRTLICHDSRQWHQLTSSPKRLHVIPLDVFLRRQKCRLRMLVRDMKGMPGFNSLWSNNRILSRRSERGCEFSMGWKWNSFWNHDKPLSSCCQEGVTFVSR